MKRPIFLAASVPTCGDFARNLDAVAIRESILALVVVTLRERELVFGGHPAISPLVEHAARSLGVIERVHIYQSRFYEHLLPEAALKFENLHWTERVCGTGDEERESLKEMRKIMIASSNFSAAVVIGGMEGIFEEVNMFTSAHPGRPVIPVASTGGAAAMVLNSLADGWSPERLAALKEERRYRRLFREFLPSE